MFKTAEISSRSKILVWGLYAPVGQPISILNARTAIRELDRQMSKSIVTRRTQGILGNGDLGWLTIRLSQALGMLYTYNTGEISKESTTPRNHLMHEFLKDLYEESFVTVFDDSLVLSAKDDILKTLQKAWGKKDLFTADVKTIAENLTEFVINLGPEV